MPMSLEQRERGGGLFAAAETVLGLALAAAPVALWVAWSPQMLVAVVAVTLVCAVLLVGLHARGASSRASGSSAGEPAWRGAALPEGFVDEVHRLFPLTHHHAWTGTARFRRAMRRLHALVSAAAAREETRDPR